jgi:hypothetical protein
MGMVMEPVVTVLPTEEPDTMPHRAEETTATLAGPPAKRPQRLFARLMKVVEYVKEGTLSTWALKILNIVNDENVNLHIECKEVSQFVADIRSIHILNLEPVRRNIKNHKFRIFLFDCDTDCLSKVCLSETWTTKKEQRIECSLAWRR